MNFTIDTSVLYTSVLYTSVLYTSVLYTSGLHLFQLLDGTDEVGTSGEDLHRSGARADTVDLRYVVKVKGQDRTQNLMGRTLRGNLKPCGL